MSESTEESKFQVEALGLLAKTPELLKHLGVTSVIDADIREVGTGNLNFIFRVVGPKGSLVVKKAPPYIRLVGKSWPLPASRIMFEQEYIAVANRLAPGSCPKIYSSDQKRFIVVMEDLSEMKVWREEIAKGVIYQGVGRDVGRYLANVHFGTSSLAEPLESRYTKAAHFQQNIKLIEVTLKVFFQDPYYDCPINGWKKRAPDLKEAVSKLQADENVKSSVYFLKDRFINAPQALLHGDLHTGSIFVSGRKQETIEQISQMKQQQGRSGRRTLLKRKTVAFDCEFTFYGPMGFDIGQLIGNICMGAFAQVLHMKHVEERSQKQSCSMHLAKQITELWGAYVKSFESQFRQQACDRNANKEEDDNDDDDDDEAANGEERKNGKSQKRVRTPFPGNDPSLIAKLLNGVWADAHGFACLAIIRRIIGIADAPEMRVGTAARTKIAKVALNFAHKQLLALPSSPSDGHVEGITRFCKALSKAITLCFLT
mmetsp:Transcript_36924/g.59936  ORF Transcript_36924/g.59936 Transcript_36924/m.59936 type:complete len:485 (+) Transcript_36924:109-1563(+)